MKWQKWLWVWNFAIQSIQIDSMKTKSRMPALRIPRFPWDRGIKLEVSRVCSQDFPPLLARRTQYCRLEEWCVGMENEWIQFSINKLNADSVITATILDDNPDDDPKYIPNDNIKWQSLQMTTQIITATDNNTNLQQLQMTAQMTQSSDTNPNDNKDDIIKGQHQRKVIKTPEDDQISKRHS
jgi:hypothetical protein